MIFTEKDIIEIKPSWQKDYMYNERRSFKFLNVLEISAKRVRGRWKICPTQWPDYQEFQKRGELILFGAYSKKKLLELFNEPHNYVFLRKLLENVLEKNFKEVEK